MHSTTLSEAESALAGTRRLMKSSGLSFARIIGTLDQEPSEAEEFEQLKQAFQIEVQRSREMAAELQFLRARADGSQVRPVFTPLKNFVLVATVLFGVLPATSIVSTIADLFRSADAKATAVDAKATAVAQREHTAAPLPAPPLHSTCWRDRSIRGPCF